MAHKNRFLVIFFPIRFFYSKAEGIYPCLLKCIFEKKFAFIKGTLNMLVEEEVSGNMERGLQNVSVPRSNLLLYILQFKTHTHIESGNRKKIKPLENSRGIFFFFFSSTFSLHYQFSLLTI